MIVHVRVKAGSKKGPLIEESTEGITLYVREQAIDGKANLAVIALLARHYGVPKTSVRLVTGHTAPFKKFEIIYT